MRTRLTQLFCLVAIIACIVLAAMVNPRIDRQREQLQLAPSTGRLFTDAPPLFNLAVIFGGPVRGLLINYLWIRFEDLKNDGKFYAAAQIAQWITELQPNYPAAWIFRAWDMAYNISVQTHTEQERWDWVNKGIALLRDKAIPYNPRSTRLYRELGWMFMHKIGGGSDDMHWHYKRELALEWTQLLGEPDRSRTDQQQIDDFARIAAVPDSLQELLRRSPDAAPVVNRLQSVGFELDDTLLRAIGSVLIFQHQLDARLGNARPQDRLMLQLTHAFPSPDHRAKAVDALINLMNDPAQKPGLDALLPYLRKSVLIHTYHMDPDFMLALMRDPRPDKGIEGFGYGPLDWRHFATHSLYWMQAGIEQLKTRKNTQDEDALNTQRLVLHSFQALTKSGRIFFNPFADDISRQYVTLPNVRFIKLYENALDAAQKLENEGVLPKETVKRFEGGHENFLLLAMTYYYLYGDLALAQAYYDKARNLYGNLPGREGKYTVPLREAVFREDKEVADSAEETVQYVDALIQRAITLYPYDKVGAARFTEVARNAHNKYRAKVEHTPNATTDRRAITDFDDLLAQAYVQILTAIPNFPPEPPNELNKKSPEQYRAELDDWNRARAAFLIEAARYWQALDRPEIRTRVYPQIQKVLKPAAAEVKIDFDKAFPPPGQLQPTPPAP